MSVRWMRYQGGMRLMTIAAVIGIAKKLYN